MSDNRETARRVEIDPDLNDPIEDFIKIEHRGTFTAACNALLLKGINAWRAEKPQTTTNAQPQPQS